ncbi:mitochondrial carrier domain-containing protein [Entophlyctis helioformis]|nr:mitochondrial carrier domain-containing protein [Entophlyctis helioformis]
MQNAASGAIAGIVSRFVIAPLDVVKIRLHLQPTEAKVINRSADAASKRKYRSILHTFRVIVREEGLRGLWKGNMPAEYLYLTYGAIQFCIFHELLKDAKRKDSLVFTHVPQSMHTFVAGAAAGTVSTLATYPLDLLRTQFAVQHTKSIYKSVFGAVWEIGRKEGLHGFYRGIVPSLIQIVPQMGLVFESHRFFKRLFGQMQTVAPTLHHWTKDWQEIICGGLAGVVSKAAVMPLDVIRKRLQVQGPVRNAIIVTDVPRYSHGILRTVVQIVKHEGVLALYKGILPSVLKAAPSSAVTFFVVNECRRAFSAMNDDLLAAPPS